MPKYVLVRKREVIAECYINSNEVKQPYQRAAELFAEQYQPGDSFYIEMGQAAYRHIEELLKNEPT